MTMMELCAQRSYERAYPAGDWETISAPWREYWLANTRSVFETAMEPSEGMLQAIMIRQASVRGERLILTDEQRDEVEMIIADYKAMLQHILDEAQEKAA